MFIAEKRGTYFVYGFGFGSGRYIKPKLAIVSRAYCISAQHTVYTFVTTLGIGLIMGTINCEFAFRLKSQYLIPMKFYKSRVF